LKSKANETKQELASLQKEVIYRDWWHFQYTNRYFKQLLLVDEGMDENVDQSFRWITETFDKFKGARMYPVEQDIAYLRDLFEFTNCLVYGYHKRTHSDGYLDIRYEVLLYEYGYPLAKIPPEDIEFVEYLHQLTLEFGYLVLPLDAQPDYTVSWELFIDKVDDFDPTKNFLQTYLYPKKGEHPKGIQISTKYHPRGIEDGWDRVIYCSLDDTDSHLKEMVFELWEPNGRREVGNSIDYDIVLFIEGDKCTPSAVLKALKLQVRWTLINQLRRSVKIFDEKGGGKFADVRPHKKLKRLGKELIEIIRFSEGLTEKQKDVETDNVRRAIGLYLWDQLYWSDKQFKSKASLVKDTVRSLEKKSKFFVLEHYRSGYEKDLQDVSEAIKAFNTVVREMLKDLDVTDYCVRHGDFFSYNRIKAAKE